MSVKKIIIFTKKPINGTFYDIKIDIKYNKKIRKKEHIYLFNKIREYTYINDKENGSYIMSNSEGIIDVVVSIINGEMNGKRTQYYNCGKIFDISYYIDNELNGENIIYDENGEITEKSYYIDGKKYKNYT